MKRRDLLKSAVFVLPAAGFPRVRLLSSTRDLLAVVSALSAIDLEHCFYHSPLPTPTPFSSSDSVIRKASASDDASFRPGSNLSASISASTMTRHMKLIDPNTGLMECAVRGSRHFANIKPHSGGRFTVVFI